MTEDKFFDEQDPPKIKRAVIAGASEALKMKKDWKKQDEEILQDIANRVDEIVERID